MPTAKDITQAIGEHLGLSAEDLDRQSLLREDLGLGPIELNDLLNYLSEKYDLSFTAQDVEELKTLDDLVALIEDNLIG